MDVLHEHHLWSRDEARRGVTIDRHKQMWRVLIGLVVLGALFVIAMMITSGYVLGY